MKNYYTHKLSDNTNCLTLSGMRTWVVYRKPNISSKQLTVTFYDYWLALFTDFFDLATVSPNLPLFHRTYHCCHENFGVTSWEKWSFVFKVRSVVTFHLTDRKRYHFVWWLLPSSIEPWKREAGVLWVLFLPFMGKVLGIKCG